MSQQSSKRLNTIIIATNYLLFLHCLALLYQFVVPALAEAAYKGFAKVLVQWLALRPALGNSATTHIPLMIVYSFELAKILNTDRIKMARYRFGEVNLPVTPRLLNGTERNSILDYCVCALSVVDQRRAWKSVDIDGRHPVALNNSDTISSHIRLDRKVDTLKDRYLLLVERRTAVALNTAGTFALLDVTAEADIGQIVRYYTVINNQHKTSMILSARTAASLYFDSTVHPATWGVSTVRDESSK